MNPIDAALVRMPIGARLKKQEEALVSRLVGIVTAQSAIDTAPLQCYNIAAQIASLRKLAAAIESDTREATETRFKEMNSDR